jgi:transcriptional regulator with XRE-family HTH domain
MPRTAQPVHTRPAALQRGRPPHTPAGKLKTWVQAHLRQRGLTFTHVAQSLGVDVATISRFFSGGVRSVHSFTEYALCCALELDDVKRRTFLRLVADAGISLAAAPAILRHTELDVEAEQHLADALQLLIDHGEGRFVQEKAEQHYAKLLDAYSETSDVKIAALQIRFGTLRGLAQEQLLPWFKRDQGAIKTYTQTEMEHILRFPANIFLQEHIVLYERRAPLLRSMGRYEASHEEFKAGIELARAGHNPWQEATLLRNGAHVYAVEGIECAWERMLAESAALLPKIAQPDRDLLEGLLIYSRAEGYKRLAFTSLRAFPLAQREQYAQHAYDAFVAAQTALHSHTRIHHLLAHISQAQCLIWLDPHMAIELAEANREEIDRYYPALIAKMEHTIALAKTYLARQRHDARTVFNLDEPRVRWRAR